MSFRLLLLNILLLSTFVFAQNRKVYIDSLFSWDGAGNTISDYSYGIQSKDIASSTVMVTDTASLRALTETRSGFDVFYNGTEISKGKFVLSDSLYAEGNGIAISSLTAAKQWVRETVKDGYVYINSNGESASKIEDLINQAGTLNLEVILQPTKTYTLSSVLNINNPVKIKSNGGTLKSGYSGVMIRIYSDSVTIDGVILDGNNTGTNAVGFRVPVNVSDSTISYFTLKNSTIKNFTNNAIAYSMANAWYEHFDIDNNRFIDVTNSAVALSDCFIRYFRYRNNWIENGNGTVQIASDDDPVVANKDSMYTILFENNTWKNVAAIPLEINALAHKVIIQNNFILGSGTRGFSLGANESIVSGNYVENQSLYFLEANQLDNLVVIGNISYNNNSFVIQSGSYDALNYVITGNEIYGCAQTGAGSAIVLRRTQNAVISGNYFYDNANNDIRLQQLGGQTTRNVQISSNTFIKPLNGNATSATTIGVDSTYNTTIGNNTFIVYDTTFSSGTAIVTINGYTTDCVIGSNKFINPYSGINDVGNDCIRITNSNVVSSGIVIRDNYGRGFTYGVNNVEPLTTDVRIYGNDFAEMTTANYSTQTGNFLNDFYYTNDTDSTETVWWNTSNSSYDTLKTGLTDIRVNGNTSLSGLDSLGMYMYIKNGAGDFFHKSQSLNKWYLSLGSALRATKYVNVVHGPGNSLNAYTADYVNKAWSTLGYGGIGYFNFGENNWSNNGVTVTLTGSWTVSDIGSGALNADVDWGISGNNITATTANDSVTVKYDNNREWRYARVWFAAGVGTSFDISVDGSTVATVTTSTGSGLDAYRIDAGSVNNHTYSIGNVNGLVKLYGLDVWGSDNGDGYVPHYLGNGGTRSWQWDDHMEYVTQFCDSVNAALIITEIGANDATDPQSATTFKGTFYTIIDSLQTINNKPPIVCMLSNKLQSAAGTDSLESYKSVFRDAIRDKGISFYNVFDMWPSYDFANNLGVMTDGTHPNNIGYDIISYGLRRALLSGYERYASLQEDNTYRGKQTFGQMVIQRDSPVFYSISGTDYGFAINSSQYLYLGADKRFYFATAGTTYNPTTSYFIRANSASNTWELFSSAGTTRPLYIKQDNITIGSATTWSNSTAKTLNIKETPTPPVSVMDSTIISIYAKDSSNYAQAYVLDGAGNETKFSPHNENGDWEYFSRNIKTGKEVRINMIELISDIERLTGKSYIEKNYFAVPVKHLPNRVLK